MSKFQNLRFKSNQDQLNYILEERVKALEDTVQLIQQDLQLIRALLSQTSELEEAISERVDERILKRLIRQHTKRLNHLKEREAKMGRDAPINIITEIEDIEGTIGSLRDLLNKNEN